MSRIEPDGLVEVVYGLFGLAQILIRISPVIVGNGQFRVEFKGLVVILNGSSCPRLA